MVESQWNEETGLAKVMQRNKFSVGEEIEVMPAVGESFSMVVEEMYTEDGAVVDSAPHPQQMLWVKFPKPVKTYDMLRKKSSQQ